MWLVTGASIISGYVWVLVTHLGILHQQGQLRGYTVTQGLTLRRPCVWGLMLCGQCLKILNNFIFEYVFCKGRLMGKGSMRQGIGAQACTPSTSSHLPGVGSQAPIPLPSGAPGLVWPPHPCPLAEAWTQIWLGEGFKVTHIHPTTSQCRAWQPSLPWALCTTACSEGNSAGASNSPTCNPGS